MEEPRHKFIRGTVGAIFILALVALVLLLYLYYFKRDSASNDSAGNSTSSEITNNEKEEAEALPPDPATLEQSSAETYYSRSLESASKKDYAQALVEINKALSLNNKIDIYWAKKASYQALLGDSDSEKATLESGLKILPDSDLLKTRLELINQNIGNTDDGVRE